MPDDRASPPKMAAPLKLLFLIICAAAAVPRVRSHESGRKVVCFHMLPIKYISNTIADTGHCTHIVYNVFTLNRILLHLIASQFDQQIADYQRNGAKVGAAIDTRRTVDLAANEAVGQIQTFVRQHHLDGITLELDLREPTDADQRNQSKITRLVEELKAGLQTMNVSLSALIYVDRPDSDVVDLARHFDWISPVMTKSLPSQHRTGKFRFCRAFFREG